MAKRESITVTRTEAADSPPAPHQVVAAITVEMRVAWPAGMGHEDDLRRVLEEAYLAALDEIDERSTQLAAA